MAFYRDVLGFKEESTFDVQGQPIQQITGFPNAHLKVTYLLLDSFRLELIQYRSPRGQAIDLASCNVGRRT